MIITDDQIRDSDGVVIDERGETMPAFLDFTCELEPRSHPHMLQGGVGLGETLSRAWRLGWRMITAVDRDRSVIEAISDRQDELGDEILATGLGSKFSIELLEGDLDSAEILERLGEDYYLDQFDCAWFDYVLWPSRARAAAIVERFRPIVRGPIGVWMRAGAPPYVDLG